MLAKRCPGEIFEVVCFLKNPTNGTSKTVGILGFVLFSGVICCFFREIYCCFSLDVFEMSMLEVDCQQRILLGGIIHSLLYAWICRACFYSTMGWKSPLREQVKHPLPKNYYVLSLSHAEAVEGQDDFPNIGLILFGWAACERAFGCVCSLQRLSLVPLLEPNWLSKDWLPNSWSYVPGNGI